MHRFIHNDTNMTPTWLAYTPRHAFRWLVCVCVSECMHEVLMNETYITCIITLSHTHVMVDRVKHMIRVIAMLSMLTR